MSYIIPGLLSALVVFSYIFVFKKPEPREVRRYGGVETDRNLEPWVWSMIIFTTVALLAWPMFWLGLGSVFGMKKLKGWLDARSAG